MELKTPPHSNEAEQAVLGGMMMDARKAVEVIEMLRYQDFFKVEHQTIFKAMAALIAKNQPSDAITLSEHLENSGALEYAGGLPYLIELSQNTPSAANTLSYAAIVKEKSILRSVLLTGESMLDMVYHPDGMNSDSIIERSYDALRAIETKTDSDIPTIEDTIISAIQQLEQRHENDGSLTGVPTGFEKLDEATMGLQKGELYIIGGRPAMGKSTLALNICMNAAKEMKHVLFFSLEMPKERIVDKCVSSLGGVYYENIKTGKMSDADWAKASQSIALLKDSGLRIDDRGGQTLNSIILKCKKLNSKRKLDLIVIDYMQLITIPGSKRFDEVSEVSRQLKALAKNLDCPVIALSQLNRGLENRTDKRPKLADLRESGQLEQDADLIAFIYRDEVYYPDQAGNKGVAELLIEKNRFGETCKILLTSELWFSRFRNFQMVNYEPSTNKKNKGGFDG